MCQECQGHAKKEDVEPLEQTPFFSLLGPEAGHSKKKDAEPPEQVLWNPGTVLSSTEKC